MSLFTRGGFWTHLEKVQIRLLSSAWLRSQSRRARAGPLATWVLPSWTPVSKSAVFASLETAKAEECVKHKLLVGFIQIGGSQQQQLVVLVPVMSPTHVVTMIIRLEEVCHAWCMSVPVICYNRHHSLPRFREQRGLLICYDGAHAYKASRLS